MKRVYSIFLPGRSIIPLLYPNRGFTSRPNTIFIDRVFAGFTDPVVSLVERPEDADYLLIPHPYATIQSDTAYLFTYAQLSERTGKQVITVLHGDSNEKIALTASTVLRTSQYRYRKQDNEVMMPAYAEDLLAGKPLQVRAKTDAPTIGFCGWSKPISMKNALSTATKNTLVRLRAMGHPHLLAETTGIALRARALMALRQTPGITCNIIERGSYSGHRDTIKGEPELMRREFVANIEGSDFVLCVKGNGNYSYRFYETLSLGRIPLLLDTACCLPLEDTIPYDDFVCRVPLADLAQIAARARAWYEACSSEEYQRRQRLARSMFEHALFAPAFFRHVFNTIL
jgi:hypothetical protein